MIFTYQKKMGQLFNDYYNDYEDIFEDFEYEVDDKKIYNKLIDFIYRDYFEVDKHIIDAFIDAFDIEDILEKAYKDKLKDYFEDEAMDYYEQNISER